MECACDCHAKGCPKVTITLGGAPTTSYGIGYTCANCGTFISTLINTGAAHQCFPRINYGTAGGSW